MAYVPPDLDAKVAHLQDVRKAVVDASKEIERKAKAILEAAPNRTGASRIVRTSGTLDRFVSLIDTNAGSIEYGHLQGPRGTPGRKWIDGLFVIHRAAGYKA